METPTGGWVLGAVLLVALLVAILCLEGSLLKAAFARVCKCVRGRAYGNMAMHFDRETGTVGSVFGHHDAEAAVAACGGVTAGGGPDPIVASAPSKLEDLDEDGCDELDEGVSHDFCFPSDTLPRGCDSEGLPAYKSA